MVLMLARAGWGQIDAHDAADAMAGLPMPIADRLSANSSDRTEGSCHCTRVFDGGQWIEYAPKDPQYKVPKLKYAGNPELSDEVRHEKISGTVSVMIYVNSMGHVEDVWLLRPLEFGLDESAEKAARQYVFEPATYEGRPVGTNIFVDVDFKSGS